MARLTLPILALALGAAAAIALVSCGGRDEKGLLPGETSAQIVANLNTVQELAQAGDCSSAALAVADVQQQIEELPNSVDPELRERLSDGADRLEDVVNEEGACEPAATETTTEPATTEKETTEEPTTTRPEKDKTTTTTTAPTTTTTTAPTTTTTTAPADSPTGGTPGGAQAPSGGDED